MAPKTAEKHVLTFEDLDAQTAVQLPDRELMCASSCSGLTIGLQANVYVGANVNLGCTSVGVAAGVGIGSCGS